MFASHMMGAYEDDEKSLMHVDLLKYKDARAYIIDPYIENAISNNYL